MVESAPPPVIVVADDEEDILELVALGLERAGYVIHRAADGEQALALIREHTPDLAILDVAMPKLDGFELTRQLRNDPETSETKIVLLTARVQEADVDAGLAAGAHDYITKPFSPQELQERVAALLQRPR
jgi:DNA-binding response OmpR family regulator